MLWVLLNSAPSTAALVFGGSQVGTPKNETELWNGTNWTEVNNLNTSKTKFKQDLEKLIQHL